MKKYRVIIAGGRDLSDYQLLERKVATYLTNIMPKDVMIISGTANGADKLGEQYAASRKLEVKQMPANWDKYGKSAGYRRNADMASVATHCICFWDGKSKGTKHMIDLAIKQGLGLKIIKY